MGIVYVDMKSEGESPTHCHPGDEFLYVRDGAVNVRLADRGYTLRLRKGDFVHFDASQLHGGWTNEGESAKLLILRFYQLKSGTRMTLFKELSPKNRPTRILRLLKELIMPCLPVSRPGESQIPTEVSDRFGLGRFIDRLFSEGSAGTRDTVSLNSLVRRATDELGLDYTRSKLDRVRHGEAPVSAKDLQHLARLFEVEPVLLANFLFPAYNDAIVVEEDEMRDLSDIGEVCQLPDGVTYRVPPRRLAYSDISLALVELEKGCATPINRHPGHELLVPLSGEVAVVFGRARSEIQENEYGHYPSYVNHCVANRGRSVAKALVIRFIE